MKYEVGQTISGFVVQQVRKIDDVKGTLVEMVHEKTKAQLVYLDRDECNKSFCIGFQTTPQDDTGVFHILEHSVLNGSRKYPVKEPFVDLLKTSLQTFLNAMTFPDKTIYPVSSRNEKDFLNLMDVYLDAVFHPAIYTNPKIFYQEGWHYEIRDPKQDPIYKGVVFNEMKGAFSAVDETIMNEANRLLFKDTCYRYVSGGDPVSIVDLSYEQFLKTHERYYHPGNARIFLDGSMNLELILTRIDSFLSEFEEAPNTIGVSYQEDQTAQSITVKHPIGEEEDVAHKTNFALAKIVGSYQDVEKVLAWEVLAESLVGSNEAPLKKALLEKELCEDVELTIIDEVLQPYMILVLRNTDPEKQEGILACIKDTIENLIKEGFRENELVAILNQMEFQYREVKEPSGLFYAREVYKSWMYGGDVALYLEQGNLFEVLRNKISSRYFEEVLKEGLGDLDRVSKILVLPDQNLGASKERLEKERLVAIKKSWSKETLSKMIEENEALDLWQASEDSPEAKASIPTLSLEDISEKPEYFKGEDREIQSVPVRVYEEGSNGIVYMNFYFSLAGIQQSDLPYVSLFTDLLGNLPTKSHSLRELKEAIQKNIGTLFFINEAFGDMEESDKCIPTISVACSCLKQNVPAAMDLILEILTETRFEESMILPFAKQSFEKGRQAFIQSGHAIALNRISAHVNAESIYKDATNGVSYLAWLKSFIKNFEEEKQEFIELAGLYQQHLFTKNRLYGSFTGSQQEKAFVYFLDHLPSEDFVRCYVHYAPLKKQQEGILIPSEVSYSACGYMCKEEGLLGCALVASPLMTYSYLWNEIRVKGGAYGTSLIATISGTIQAMSYRDPTPFESLKVMKEGGTFLEELAQADLPLSGNIIGTIAQLEPLLSPMAKVRSSDGKHFRGYHYEKECEIRKEVLHTTNKDLARLAKNYQENMKDAPTCVVGPRLSLEGKLSEEDLIDLFS